jgi:hypothetical protein
VVVGGGHERVGQLDEGVPVRQGRRARIQQFVFGLKPVTRLAGRPGESQAAIQIVRSRAMSLMPVAVLAVGAVVLSPVVASPSPCRP